jgi:hypothetical protein
MKVPQALDSLSLILSQKNPKAAQHRGHANLHFVLDEGTYKPAMKKDI